MRGRRDPEGADHTFLPRLTLRDLGPVVDADHRGLHGLPDVDVGVAGDPDVAVIDLGSDPRLLRAVDEVVEQDAEATAIAGAKARTRSARSSAPSVVRRRHLDAQVGAPDLLDEFGVVDALDPDSAGAGDSGGNIACVDRPAGGDLRPLGFGLGRTSLQGTPLLSMSARTDPSA